MENGTVSNITEENEISMDAVIKAQEKIGKPPKPKELGIVSLQKDCKNVCITNGWSDYIIINENNFQIIKTVLDNINKPNEE